MRILKVLGYLLGFLVGTILLLGGLLYLFGSWFHESTLIDIDKFYKKNGTAMNSMLEVFEEEYRDVVDEGYYKIVFGDDSVTYLYEKEGEKDKIIKQKAPSSFLENRRIKLESISLLGSSCWQIEFVKKVGSTSLFFYYANGRWISSCPGERVSKRWFYIRPIP